MNAFARYTDVTDIQPAYTRLQHSARCMHLYSTVGAPARTLQTYIAYRRRRTRLWNIEYDLDVRVRAGWSSDVFSCMQNEVGGRGSRSGKRCSPVGGIRCCTIFVYMLHPSTSRAAYYNRNAIIAFARSVRFVHETQRQHYFAMNI